MTHNGWLTVTPVLGLRPLFTFCFHLFRGRVVHISLPLIYKLLCILDDLLEVVRGVCELVGLDLQHGDIFQDNLKQKNSFSSYKNKKNLNLYGCSIHSYFLYWFWQECFKPRFRTWLTNSPWSRILLWWLHRRQGENKPASRKSSILFLYSYSALFMDSNSCHLQGCIHTMGCAVIHF